jgi:hypothetical protein
MYPMPTSGGRIVQGIMSGMEINPTVGGGVDDFQLGHDRGVTTTSGQ